MNLAEGLKSYEKNLPVRFCLAEAFLYCALKFWSRAFRVLARHPAVWNFKNGICKHCFIQWSKVIFQLCGNNSLSHPASRHAGLLC